MLAVMAVYVDARTTVRTVYDNSKVFIVGTGMHPGSGLSPCLLAVVMEAMCSEFPVVLFCELR